MRGAGLDLWEEEIEAGLEPVHANKTQEGVDRAAAPFGPLHGIAANARTAGGLTLREVQTQPVGGKPLTQKTRSRLGCCWIGEPHAGTVHLVQTENPCGTRLTE